MPKNETKMKKSSDAVEILNRQIRDNPGLRRQADAAVVNAQVAQMLYDVRTRAKLTQKQLAQIVGTTQSVIARIEDADYEGHSLSMLQRIASALNKRLEIRFVSGGRRIAA